MDDDAAWRTAWAFKDHGKSYEVTFERYHPPGFRYVYETFSTNWRMLEIQAAIGRIQLRKLPAWHERRHAIGSRIDAALRELPGLRAPVVPERLRHAYYRTYAYVRPEALRFDWDRERVIDEIVAGGVPCYIGSAAEIELEKAFRDAGLGPTKRLPAAQELGDVAVLRVPSVAHGRARGPGDRSRHGGDGAGGALTNVPVSSRLTDAATPSLPWFVLRRNQEASKEPWNVGTRTDARD